MTDRTSRRRLGTSVGLVSGKTASLAVGFLFWLLAARAADPSEVGLAAGAVSLMMLATQLAVAGTGSSFILLRRHHDPARLLDTAVTLVLLLGSAAGALALLAVGLASEQLRVVATSAAFGSLFLAMTVLGTLGILLDHVSVALDRGEQVLVRNTVGGALTAAPLLLVPLLGARATAEHLFGLWVLGGAVTSVVGAVQLSRDLGGYRYRPRLPAALVGSLVRTGLPNHALTLVERAPNLLLPVVVTELLSAEANAYWYMAWMMAWAVLVVPVSVGLTLLSAAVEAARQLRADVSRAARTGLLLGLAAAAAVALAGPTVLGLLGDGFGQRAGAPLRILLLALGPVLVLQLYYAVCRATRRLPEALCTGSVTGACAVAAAALTAGRFGLVGLAWCWVAVQCVAGTWAGCRLAFLLRASDRSPVGHQVSLAAAP